MLKRLYHFALRFKEAFLYTTIILTSFVSMLAFFYPGDEGMEAYIGIYSESFLIAIVGEGLEAGGFLFWITLQISVYIYYILVITAIRIGARIIPTTREDGVELSVGANALSSRRFLGENLISAILVLALAIIPSYFILMISVANQEGDNSVILERLATTYFFAFAVAISYMSIATLVSVFFFRRDWGVKAGLFYLIYSFIIELVSGTVNDLLGGYLDTIQEKTGFDMSGIDIGNISLNHYVNPTGGLLSGEYDWVPVFVTLGISGVFFGIAFWKVKTREYIEVAPKAKNGRQINLFGPEGKLAQKYPLVFEQLRSDFGALIGWFIFNLAMVFMMPSLLPSEEDFASLMTGFDMPMFRAFTLGNEFRFDYTGFMAVEFFGITFMYFGMFMMFSAISIPTKETREDNQDIVWGSNLSQSKIVVQRTLVLLFETSILIWVTYGMMRLSENMQGMVIDTGAQFQAFVIIWLQYMMFTLVLVGLAMIIIPSKSRSVALWFYILTYMFLIFGYSAEALEWMISLSLFSYYDVVGVLYGVADFGVLALWAVIGLVAAILFFIVILKYRFKKIDMI